MDKNLIKEFELAEKLMSEKQYEESILHFKKVLEYNPNQIPALYNIGLCHEFSKQFREA